MPVEVAADSAEMFVSADAVVVVVLGEAKLSLLSVSLPQPVSSAARRSVTRIDVFFILLPLSESSFFAQRDIRASCAVN